MFYDLFVTYIFILLGSVVSLDRDAATALLPRTAVS
jgi:hypothetical protein